MNKKLGILLSAVFFLLPCAVKADIDFASIIQDKLSTVEEEVNKVLKQYTNIQVHIQEFRNNRDILNTLKDKAKQEIAARKAKLIQTVRAQTVSLKGIGSNLNMGDFVGADLVAATRSKYTKKKDAKKDFEKVKEHQREMNKMLVENVATLYARALVKRYEMQEDESKALEKEADETAETLQNAQLPTVKQAYIRVKNRANGRWKTILQSTADFKGLIINGVIAENTISSEEEAESELEKAAQEQEQANKDNKTEEVTIKVKGPTVGQLMDLGSKGIQDINTNNWWQMIDDAGGSYGIISGEQSDLSSMLRAGAGAVANAGRSGTNGNWAGALNSLAQGTGAIGNTSGTSELKDIANAASGVAGLAQGGGNTNTTIDNITKVVSGTSGQETSQAEFERQRQEDALKKKMADDWQKAMEDAMKDTESLKAH